MPNIWIAARIRTWTRQRTMLRPVPFFSEVSYLALGSMLDDGEALNSDNNSERPQDPDWRRAFHVSYELGGEQAVKELPG